MFQQRCWHSLTPKCCQTGILCFSEVLGCFTFCFAAAEAIYGSTCVYGVYTPCQHNLLIKMTSRVHPSVLGLRSGGQVLISCMICGVFRAVFPGGEAAPSARASLDRLSCITCSGSAEHLWAPAREDGDCFKWREGRGLREVKDSIPGTERKDSNLQTGSRCGQGCFAGFAAQLDSRTLLCSAPGCCFLKLRQAWVFCVYLHFIKPISGRLSICGSSNLLGAAHVCPQCWSQLAVLCELCRRDTSSGIRSESVKDCSQLAASREEEGGHVAVR